MKIEINIININGSRYLRIPPLMLKHLNIKEGNTIIIEDEQGKHGNFFSAWKK